MLSKFWTRLKESRTFWAYLVGAIVIMLRVVLPKFPVSDEALGTGLGLLVAFVIAEGFEGFRPAKNVFSTLIKSRKFQLVVAGIIVSAATASSPDFPFTEEQVLQAMNWVMGIVLGLGVEGAVTKG